MEGVKKEATGATTAAVNISINQRIEEISIKYLDFLDKALVDQSTVDVEVVHALNDCIRIMHHLKKISEY